MPDTPDTDMPDAYPIRFSEEFAEGLARIWSPRVLDQIQHLTSLLPTTPEMGSADVRKSLITRYGPNLRKLPVSTFVIVYRFDGVTVEVLALEYGPGIT